MYRMSLEDYASLTVAQRELIVSIQNLNQVIEGPVLKQWVAGLIPPTARFANDIQRLSGTNAELRNFLNGHGCNLSRHPSRKIVSTLAHELYDEAEEHDAAI